MGVTSGQVLLCPLWVDLLPHLNLEHLPQCRNSWIFPTETPLMLTQMCIFNFANCWRLNADTTNEHWFNQEINQRQERTERGNRDNLISRSKAWLPPSCGNSTVHLWDLPLCKELPPSFLPEKGKRLEKPELLGRKWWCLSQAKTQTMELQRGGFLKGFLKEPGSFQSENPPELFWWVLMEHWQPTHSSFSRAVPAFVFQHIPAHSSAELQDSWAELGHCLWAGTFVLPTVRRDGTSGLFLSF